MPKILKNNPTPYQVEIYNKLAEVAGFCSESQNLRFVGVPIRAFIWNVGKKNRSPRRNEILVMADKAMDMGLQVYRMKKIPVSTLVSSEGCKFEITDKNEEVRRIAVWCPEESS